jgi:hypothetical protein
MPAEFRRTECDLCGGELQPHSGWMLYGSGYEEVCGSKSANGHTAIDIVTRTASQGLYFLEEFVRSGEGFAGEMLAWDDQRAELGALLQQAAKEGLRIGHGKHKGMGWVQVEWEEGFRLGGPSLPVEDRIRGMQKRLRSTPGYENSAGFSVTLQSRTILLDEYLRFRSRLRVSDLLEAVQAGPGASGRRRSGSIPGIRPPGVLHNHRAGLRVEREVFSAKIRGCGDSSGSGFPVSKAGTGR